jgi:ABC-type multidrug transport system fused ATPase/permease subunit
VSSSPSSRRLNWRLIGRIVRPYRWQMLALAGVLAATIAIRLATPLVAGRFIDAATGGAPMDALVGLAVLAIALAFLGQGIAIAETWLAERVGWSATNALRETLAAHVLHLDAAFHHAHRPGELIERVDGDVGTLARLFSRFVVYVVGNALFVLGVLALLFALDWRVGLGLSCFVAAALGAMLRLRAAASPFSATERQAAADVYGFLGEHLSGLEDVRASDARAFVLRRYAELMRAWLSARIGAQMRG